MFHPQRLSQPGTILQPALRGPKPNLRFCPQPKTLTVLTIGGSGTQANRRVIQPGPGSPPDKRAREAAAP